MRPRTSKCVLEDVLEAKDVLEDSTSDKYIVLYFKGNDVICDSDGEDERSLHSHIKTMVEECKKRTIDLNVLEDRMKRSFFYRRKEVCSGIISIPDLLQKYPALHFPSCVSGFIMFAKVIDSMHARFELQFY